MLAVMCPCSADGAVLVMLKNAIPELEISDGVTAISVEVLGTLKEALAAYGLNVVIVGVALIETGKYKPFDILFVHILKI
jgi:hypothetical protein